MLNNIFSNFNANPCLVMTVFLLLLTGAFTVAQFIENKCRKDMEQQINNLHELVKIQDATITYLSEELKRERSRTFAARTDCKRETATRDRKIDALEYRLNQLLKADKD